MIAEEQQYAVFSVEFRFHLEKDGFQLGRPLNYTQILIHILYFRDRDIYDAFIKQYTAKAVLNSGFIWKWINLSMTDH